MYLVDVTLSVALATYTLRRPWLALPGLLVVVGGLMWARWQIVGPIEWALW